MGDSEANAALRFSSPGGNEAEPTGTVTVSGWSGEGTYKGSLDLDQDSAKATAIPLDVKVRDSILWPILFVVLGALSGGFGVRAYGLHKRRDLLRAELKATNEQYKAEENKSHPYALDDDLVGGIRDPTNRQCKRQPGTITGEIGQLYCAIHTAKTDPEFATVTARTRVVMARFANWHDLRRELDRLDAALEFAGPGAGTSIRTDTEELVRRVGSEPPADQAPGMVAAFREQRQVLRAYKRLADRFNALSPADRQRLGRYQPDSLYDDAPPAELGGSGARVWPTLNLFDAATDALADPASAPTVPPGAPPEEEHDEILVGPRLMFASDTSSYIHAPRADRRSSREILVGLRRWDWTLGITTAALTVLVYVVGIYTDTYGGWVAYATAFAAGFFTQTTLAAVGTAISQLPPFQSYRLGPDEPAKEPA